MEEDLSGACYWVIQSQKIRDKQCFTEAYHVFIKKPHYSVRVLVLYLCVQNGAVLKVHHLRDAAFDQFPTSLCPFPLIIRSVTADVSVPELMQ